MIFKIFIFLLFVPLFLIGIVSAHCPLCTIGAGAAAAGAAWLGVSKIVIGLMIGAFAMSMGMWFAKTIKKQYVPFQKTLIVVIVFLTTVLPLLPIISAIGPLYIKFIGEYGKTYAFNYSIASSLLGGVIVFISPTMSKQITKFRKGKFVPFQGTLLTLVSLIVIGVIIQLIV